jgi:16S rRNA (guanine1207-N2)-methyltransferase
VPSDPVLVEETVAGLRLRLWTDHGVFSRGHIDTGTRALIGAMVINAQERVLDWGAGYGVIGIAAALLEPECHVTMVEVNRRAVELAQLNIRENGVANAEVIEGDAPGVLGELRFDRILCNAPVSRGRALVEAIIDDAAERLNPGGEFWAVIHTKKGARRYLQYMEQRFDTAWTETITGGYRVIVGRTAEG